MSENRAEQSNPEELPIPEKEMSREEELSPETIEMIMGKVQDIGEYGIAYTALGMKSHKDVKELSAFLNEGVLGTSWLEKSKESLSKEKWKKDLRKNDAVVHFNIVGRGLHRKAYDGGEREEYPPEQEILHAEWNGERITLLFDLEGFVEDAPKFTGTPKVPPLNHFMPSFSYNFVNKIEPKEFEGWPGELKYNERGDIMSNSEWGFILSSRIPPRRFKGLIVNNRNYSNAEVIDAMSEIYKERKELLLPIYNFFGGLEWPKKMSYQEVKQFVEERDKKEKTNE